MNHFPRICFTRRKLNDKSLYFGPYTSVAKSTGTALDFIRQNIPPHLHLALSQQNIEKEEIQGLPGISPGQL